MVDLGRPRVAKKQLTTIQVRTLGPGLHSDGGRLYLAVGPSSRSWVFRYQFRGRRREMGFGAARVITLADARHMAHTESRRLLIDRVDPIEHRRATESAAIKETKRITFEQCTTEYLQTHKSAWVPKHARAWEQSMRDYVLPTIGKVPVEKIKLDAVVGILKPMWLEKPKLSEDLRFRIGAVLDFAIGSEYRTGDNPAKSKHLTKLLPKRAETKPHEAIDWRDLPIFMASLRALDSIAARAIEFCILCASRRDEVRLARWDEINLEERLWTVPKERMKTRAPHDVPLSSAAMAVLHRMAAIRVNDYVFSGASSKGTVGATSMTTTILASLKRSDITLHGFRATFSTLLNKRGFNEQMIEHALAHTVGTKVKRAYDREKMVEERRALMEYWADYCAGVEPGQNVVPLRA